MMSSLVCTLNNSFIRTGVFSLEMEGGKKKHFYCLFSVWL